MVMEHSEINAYIVDDEMLVLNGYKAILCGNGINVVGCATNAKTAIAEIPIVQPNITIMDINLPDMDGITAVKEIQMRFRVPCILITGYHDPALVARATEIGVFGYLHKPVDELELVSMIEIAIKRFQEEESLRVQADRLQKSLEERKVIERAKGLLMDEFGFKEDQAMKYLQKKSRETNRKLFDIARQIINAYIE